jgi:hypothetical protein
VINQLKELTMRTIAAFIIAVISSAGFAAGGADAQAQSPLSAADVKEISGRWIGTVNADIGTMPIALNLKATDGKVSGVLETGHGNWEIRDVKKADGTWIVAVKAPDGLEGTMTGRVKEGKLTGDWNFKPRAVGTFALARPAQAGEIGFAPTEF